MKITVITKQEVEVKYLKAECAVRYWEDALVNGEHDESGDNIPCRVKDIWSPLIDLSTGIIDNWEQGKTANIHYKICDAGVYTLLDEARDDVKLISGYVPSIMCPEGGGYGDYVIMKVDENGKINNFKCTLDEFEEDE